MAIERFIAPKTVFFRGLEDTLPPELQSFGLELVRRLEERMQGLETAMQISVISDSSVLPPLSGGASATADYSVATSRDIEMAFLLGMYFA